VRGRARQPDGEGPCGRGEAGLGRAKRTVARKRPIAVNANGRLLMVNLTPGDISDSAGAGAVLRAPRAKWPWMMPPFADSAYDRVSLMDEVAMLGFTLGAVRKIEDQTAFQILLRRWVSSASSPR